MQLPNASKILNKRRVLKLTQLLPLRLKVFFCGKQKLFNRFSEGICLEENSYKTGAFPHFMQNNGKEKLEQFFTDN